MSARYEISEGELDVLAITGPEGTRYLDGEDIEARVIRQQCADIAELEVFAEIGRQWNADSSLAKWFPLTAERVEQDAQEIAKLRAELAAVVAKTESSMSFKLWLNDMDESADPIEWTIHGTSRDIGRMQARLRYFDEACKERDNYRDEFSGLCHTLSVGSEGRPEMTAQDWRKRVDEGIDFLMRPLLLRIEATDRELAKRSKMLDICTQNCSDWIGRWKAEQDRAEQAEARLSAIDSAPVVAHIANKIGPDYFPCGLTILADSKLPPLGTDLIARPAKD